jgi:hypothetical protein
MSRGPVVWRPQEAAAAGSQLARYMRWLAQDGAANVDLAANNGDGDGAADTVVVNGSDRAEHVRVNRAGSQVLTTGLAAQTTITGSEAANDVLRVNTLGGRDDVQVAADVSTLITPIVDLGADQ